METLLFIPDISGFTEFVNATEIEHSRHIISELLELVIAEDDLGLEVAEVEGDAVFFYSEADVPPVEAVLQQAERTFLRFHEHLKLYENRRICDCGACVTAHRLSLKFVAHRADVGFTAIRGHRKPHGPDVILAHRLLKNSVPSSEYLLATDALIGETRSAASWGAWEMGRTNYDDVGPVDHCHVLMTPLRARVPEPPKLEDYPLMDNPVLIEALIDRPRDAVFQLVSNLRFRHLWNDDADEIQFPENRVNRAGLQHQCVVKGDLISFETVKADMGEGVLVMGERVDSVPLVESFAAFWIVQEAESGSRVRVEVHFEPLRRGGKVAGFLFRIGARRLMRRALRSLEAAALRQAV